MSRPIRIADLRGAARLAAQAVAGVTDIVEGVHQSVWSTLGVAGASDARTRGITGMVYGSIRGMTRWIGGGADALLAGLEPLLESDAPADNAAREALLAALNGVMGDRLAQDGNPLATSMTFRNRDGAVLDVSPPNASGKVLLLIHGLCMNDLQWRSVRDGERVDHGGALADAHGYTPLYLRYNSGRHVFENGDDLADLLETTLAAWPVPIEELAVIGHSMGGLLIRSAVASATARRQRWLRHLKRIVFLGTPHHGAPLERAGNWIDGLLASTPFTRPFAALGQLRSAGITDLRHGFVREHDGDRANRFERGDDTRVPLPLPDGVACHSIAATLASQRGTVADRMLGDGLVPLDSALGRNRRAGRTLDLPHASQRIVYRTGHIDLLRSDEVRRQLVEWLAPAPE